MHNLASFLVNETHKPFWDFEVQTDHQISTRQPDLILINKRKKTYRTVNFAVPADLSVNLKESERRKRTSTLQGN